MPFRYLLDTNILSDLIRNPQGGIAERITRVGETSICTSIIVVAELRYGAEKSGSNKLSDRIELILSAIEILPMESPVDKVYGRLRHSLASKGLTIGPNDMLIAAHALEAGLTMVTANVREFSRVAGLNIENWLAE